MSRGKRRERSRSLPFSDPTKTVAARAMNEWQVVLSLSVPGIAVVFFRSFRLARVPGAAQTSILIISTCLIPQRLLGKAENKKARYPEAESGEWRMEEVDGHFITISWPAA